MKTFKLDRVTYTHNKEGYFAQVDGGKRGRITKEAYDRAMARATGKKPTKTEKVVVLRPLERVIRKAQIGGVMAEDGERSVLLTKSQLEFLRDFNQSGFSTPCLTRDLIDYIGDGTDNVSMTIGALISTLREKGVLITTMQRMDGRAHKAIVFTEFGSAVLRALRETK